MLQHALANAPSCLMDYFKDRSPVDKNEHEYLEAFYPSLVHSYFGSEDCVKISSLLFKYHNFDQLDTKFPMGCVDNRVRLIQWYLVPKQLIIQAFQDIFQNTTYRAIYLRVITESIYTEIKLYTNEWLANAGAPEWNKKYASIDPTLRVRFE
jgi:hypothetical protein